MSNSFSLLTVFDLPLISFSSVLLCHLLSCCLAEVVHIHAASEGADKNKGICHKEGKDNLETGRKSTILGQLID